MQGKREAAFGSAKTGRLPCLMAVSNGRMAAGDLVARCEALLQGGLDTVQLREPGLGARELYDLAAGLLPICRKHGALLLINRRLDVALAAGADGVHLGGSGVSPAEARRLVGPDMIIGFSAHGPGDLALLDGADYVTVSPVFATGCKPGAVPLGLEGLAKFAAAAPLPVLALGGLTADKLALVPGTGAAGAAFMSAVFSSPDARATAAELVRAFAAGKEREDGGERRCVCADNGQRT